jgi:hypothetical protein
MIIGPTRKRGCRGWGGVASKPWKIFLGKAASAVASPALRTTAIMSTEPSSPTETTLEAELVSPA